MAKKTVYVVIEDWQYDVGDNGINVWVFDTKKKAENQLLKLYHEVKDDFESKNYDSMIVLGRSISYWEPEEWAYNHYSANIFKREINELYERS